MAAVLAAIVQGITEFLPISSSGHLVIVPWGAGIESRIVTGLTFAVAVHLGTGLAAISTMRLEWRDLLVSVRSSQPQTRSSARRKLVAIVAGTIVLSIAGLALESIVETALREPWIVALALIAGGAALYAADRLGGVKTADGQSLAIWTSIAVVQAGALVPGVSRSGLAMTAGRALGVGRLEATKFSFLLMAPAILGAAALRGFRLAQSGAAPDELAILGLGLVLSAVSGFFAARWLLSYVSNNGFGAFAIYRAALGIAVLILFAIRA
ncbi:MAG: undecaprenyl-diphosphate phosphatase [Chloroflexi bacterium]|nr:undecaprenyl-diphosphate phosphatase [Chloroflexota bacterium]